MDVLDADDPPARLLVGHTAVQMVRAAMAHQAAEIDRWEVVSDTDGDGRGVTAAAAELTLLTLPEAQNELTAARQQSTCRSWPVP